MSEEIPSTEQTDSRSSNSMKWLSGVAALVGLWILISPFTFVASDAALWNNVVVGIAIFLIAGYNYYRLMNDRASTVGAMAIVALLGIWTLIAPFAFDIGSDELLWSNVAGGVLVILAAGTVANSSRKMRAGAPGTTE